MQDQFSVLRFLVFEIWLIKFLKKNSAKFNFFCPVPVNDIIDYGRVAFKFAFREIDDLPYKKVINKKS